jgi:DEAD/DEAH box helicase domain-containing protein
LAFLLRSAATSLLDVDANELEAGVRTVPKNHVPTGQVFLSDSLDNGAGYARWLGEPVNFADLLARILGADSNCIAALWGQTEKGEREAHGRACDTSCNRCLRDHANTIYHPWLDWRLALDMARLAADAHAKIDLRTAVDGRPNDWIALVDAGSGRVPRMLHELGWAHHKVVNGLNVYRFVQDQARYAIEVHPLWSEDHPELRAARDELTGAEPDIGIQVVNPFLLIRQPATVFGRRRDSRFNRPYGPY